MTSSRLTGVVDWYNVERGFGLIIGYDGAEYFVHFTNLSPGLAPVPGQRLTFQARPRRGKAGMEAFQIEAMRSPMAPTPGQESVNRTNPSKPSPLTNSIKPANTVSAPSAFTSAPPTTDSAAATRAAAAEVLELQRQRKKGLASPRVEPFPVGMRVAHPHHGAGTVVLAALEIVSVRFDRDPRRHPRPATARVRAGSSTTDQPCAPISGDCHTRERSPRPSPASLRYRGGRASSGGRCQGSADP